jgi:hypothetical protein
VAAKQEEDGHSAMMRALEEEQAALCPPGSVPSLVDLCARQIGHDLHLYVAPSPGEGAEGQEEAEEGRQALLEVSIIDQ